MEPAEKNSRFWKKCRVCFRRFRITVLAVIFLLLCVLLYLNQVGIPGFIKKPVLAALQQRGIEFEFTRMRWRWQHGIVAENVRFARSDNSGMPHFFAREAQVQLDYRALLRRQIQVRGLVLHRGQLAWPVEDESIPNRKVSLEEIQAELRLMPGDLWELNEFQAQFAGARLYLGGVLTNASAIRDWKPVQQREPSAPDTVQKRLQQLADTLDQIRFSTAPELHLDVRGDARDLQSFSVRLNLNTPDADTPWGNVHNVFLTIALLPGDSNVLSHATVSLEASRAHTRWAGGDNLRLQLKLLSTAPNTNLIDADLNLRADNIETRWGVATNATLGAHWVHSLTNAIPISGSGTVDVKELRGEFGTIGQLQFTSAFEKPDRPPVATGPDWAWWTNLAPYSATWECALVGLESPRLEVRQFSCSGAWLAPELKLNRISAALYEGTVHADAAVDVATRRFSFSGASDFDPHHVKPLLTAKSSEWISQFGWSIPPKLNASGSLVLPPWTGFKGADWRNGVRPTIRLDGHFDVGPGSFRGVGFDSANSHFSYSNLFWRLPDLVARRPEGMLELQHISNEATRDYHFKVHSTIHPAALKPLLETNQHRIYEVIGVTEPPVIDGEIRGRWYDPASIGAAIRIAATNFTVHGQPFDHATASVDYTNLWVRISEPTASRSGGREHGSATSVDIDIAARKIYLTNAVGVADPLAVSRAVGPNIGRHMEPYRFVNPVRGRADGVIPMRDERDADLHFVLEGGPFEWWRFKVPAISGKVHWIGEHLRLEGLHAQFYGGTASGEASFDFHNRHGARFHFDVLANDADLHLIMSDLMPRTNRLEGRLNGRLTITDGFSTNLHTLQGSGRVNLRDGLIWDIPLFGVLSPVLDGIAPGLGLGSSRAREGSATFTITNGVIHSSDLEIGASMMRLQYWGTVDIESAAVDARAQAELFRDTPAIGRLLSVTLWPVSKIFEYRFTGTLNEPRSEPVFFVPKILLLPFQPFRMLKEMAPDTP